jgi:hypothetical protein
MFFWGCSHDRPNMFKGFICPFQATSLALSKHPIVNSTVLFPAAEDKSVETDEAMHELLQHRRHNIGIAMDTTGGLVVPVIRYTRTQARCASTLLLFSSF